MAASTRHERIAVMGTVVTVDLFGVDGRADELLHDATQSLHRADEMFSLWKPESPFARLRRGELALTDADVRHTLSQRLDFAPHEILALKL